MIFCFTGNGNSRLVAEELQRRLYSPDDPTRQLYMLEADRLIHPS